MIKEDFRFRILRINVYEKYIRGASPRIYESLV